MACVYAGICDGVGLLCGYGEIHFRRAAGVYLRPAPWRGVHLLAKGRVYRLHRTGDEFAVILPNYDQSEARATAERIRSAAEQQKPGGDISVTTSICGFVATGDITAEEALQKADQAMLVAKKTKNTVHFA